MPPKKRTPSNSKSTNPSPKSRTPVPEIPPTSPVTPSKLPKKQVKIHPETQVETFVIDEPIHPHIGDETERLIDKKGGASAAVSSKPKDVKASPAPDKAPSVSLTKPQTVSKPEKHGKYYRDEAAVRADNEEMEKEITQYVGTGAHVWHGNTLILVPEKSDTLHFETIKEYCKSHPAAKRSEVFAATGSRPNADALIKIARDEPLDCLLTYHYAQTVTIQDKTRYEFLKRLVEEKCIVTIENGHKNPKFMRIVRVVIPFEKMCILAEDVELKMPLKKAYITKYIKDFEKKQVTPQSQALSIFFHTYKYAKLCKEKRSVAFECSKIKEFENGDFSDNEKLKCDFFTPAKRNYLVKCLLHSIHVINSSAVPEPPFTTANFRKEWKIDDLLVKKVFLECQALHVREATELAKKVSLTSIPSVLDLQNYFGDEWGFYFALVEFYKEFCFRMFYPGVLMILWSIVNYTIPSASPSVSNSIFGTLAGFLGIFDNASISAYAFVMNVGGLLFLKFWKRRSSCLAFLWDASELPLLEKERAAWKPSAQKEYSYITGEMVPFESNRSRTYRILASSIFLSLLFALVIALGAVDVVIYAYVTNNTVLGTNVQPTYGVPGAIGIVAIVACIHLLFFEWILNISVGKIVQGENIKIESKHRNRFISAQFFLQFFNSFAFLLFMCLARPMMAQSLSFNYYYGTLGCKAQGSSNTCLQELVILVLVMFVIQQFLHLVFCWALYVIRRIQVRNTKKYTPTSLQKYQSQDTLSEHALARQYSDKLLQFGNLVLFAAAFPLGPLVAILNNYVQVRLDIHRFLLQFKRKWAERKSGAGLWERWIVVVVYLSIVVNGLSIPYISDGFYWVSSYFASNNYVAANFQYSQVGFFLVYVFVLSLIAASIHFWVPDVPRQVAIGIEAEKYISLRRNQLTP